MTVWSRFVVWHLHYTALAIVGCYGNWVIDWKAQTSSRTVFVAPEWLAPSRTVFLCHPSPILLISRPPHHNPLLYCSLLTNPSNPNLRAQIRNTNTELRACLWDHSVCVLAVSQSVSQSVSERGLISSSYSWQSSCWLWGSGSPNCHCRLEARRLASWWSLSRCPHLWGAAS
jgi:hypothetical protein